MLANVDVGVSSSDDSDVEGADAPAPAAKVVDTNDPHRAIDQRYKSVEQGGEGAGLSKGDNVTVHFRMAAVTPNNADGDGPGVQEDTTYYMELPW